MKQTTTNELQTQLSKILKEVEKGEVYQISRYSKSVAYLVSKEEFENLISGSGCKACMQDMRKIADKIKE